MKKLLLTFSLFALTTSAQAGWLDDWYDASTASDPTHYNNQKRGFYSLGGYQARTNLTTDYLASIELPRISAGCGGIDGFLGGLSFLDEDYLVQKFQNVIQAAPALAFNMALKKLAPQLSSAMVVLTDLEQQLNGTQLDDCALSKGLVATIANSPNGDTLGAMWNRKNAEISAQIATTKNYLESRKNVDAAGGDATENLNAELDSCPQNIKDVFKQGSLLNNMMTKASNTDYVDLMRGVVGDIIIDTTSSNIPNMTVVAPCPNNTSTLRDMTEGTIEGRSPAGVCARDTTTSVLSKTLDHMQGIATKLSDSSNIIDFTQDEVEFIQNTQIPILQLLKQGVSTNTQESVITTTYTIAAKNTSYLMFEELLRNLRSAMLVVSADVETIKSKNLDNCSVEVFEQAIYKIHDLTLVVNDARNSVFESYANDFTIFTGHLQLIAGVKANQDRITNKTIRDTEK